LVNVSKKRIEIIATDGRKNRRILWVEQARDGSFYWGPIYKNGGELRSTYKASGQRRAYELEKQTVIWSPIAKFKGACQLAYYGMTKDLSALPFKPYISKKIDGIVYVDYRTLQRRDFHASLYLVEKGHPEYLQRIIELFPNANLHLFTFTNPWTLVLIH
jgi:hypothetical protein